jgi:hypothetical protein
MKIANKFISLGTVAALAFVCWSPDTSAASQQGAMMAKHANGVKCYGVNKCKGRSACATNANKCKSMNSCKGKGVKMMKSEKACTKKGGSMTDTNMKRHHHNG